MSPGAKDAAVAALAAAAELLSYPGRDLPAVARRFARAAAAVAPEAAARAERFGAAAERAGPGALEEAHTAAFEIAPTADLYVGHALFGDSGARSALLARLNAIRREIGLAPGDELPDHLAEVLRLAAAMPAGTERDELVADGALPVARAGLGALDAEHHVYADALGAIVALLERCAAIAPGPARAEVSP